MKKNDTLDTEIDLNDSELSSAIDNNDKYINSNNKIDRNSNNNKRKRNTTNFSTRKKEKQIKIKPLLVIFIKNNCFVYIIFNVELV